MKNNSIRNLAIIAHVDHGKTSLIDVLLRQARVFRENEQVAERVMDSNDLERERGITILSKNTAIFYNGVKINIIDTPGHSDFSGEVERVLNMADGVLLLVDAFEGVMSQTRYVLRKALEHKLKPIVVINKIDRPDARIDEVNDEILELFMELGADDEQLDFPVIYTSAKLGIAKKNIHDDNKDLKPLLDTILTEIPAPEGELDKPLQMVVTTLEANDYVGKLAIGRIHRGKIKSGETVALMSEHEVKKAKVGKVFTYDGLNRVEVPEASMGEIVALTGLGDISIGDTIADVDKPEALPAIRVDEPTLSVTFGVNTSPFAGREGQFVTSRHIRDRLFKEAQTNVALRVEETDSADVFKVSGRGELHLSILIETMRREGYEMQIGKPEVVYKIINGKKLELEDIEINKKIGDNGATIVPKGATILTHCNAGALATVGYGTALGVVRSAFANDNTIQVFADETRPRQQGARLTTFELTMDGIPTTLITDGMCSYFMKKGMIDLVIVGADRIAANGDAANKIGTYTVAIAAKYHNVPFYVAAPASTIDTSIKSGDEIVIEERSHDEVTHINGKRICADGVNIINPGFDVTPAQLITGIITEKGIFKPEEIKENF